jgi:hypothetical protein
LPATRPPLRAAVRLSVSATAHSRWPVR